MVFQGALLHQRELMRAYGAHAVVISPHGRGLDCYRTWEALFMGCIVAVKRSPLDGLYEGLPVVILDDWREIDAANIRRWVDRFTTLDRTELRKTLSFAYWRRLVAGGQTR